jgi:hypothetical protein
MILVGREERRRLGPEEMVVDEHAADDRQHDERAQDDAEARRFEGGGAFGHERHICTAIKPSRTGELLSPCPPRPP